MMTALDLARRAVVCAGWRWMPGMLCLTDEDGYAARVLIVGLKASTSETADAYCGGGIITRGCLKDDSLPDLDDGATKGCLLALVREVWRGTEAYCYKLDGYGTKRWVVGDTCDDLIAGPCATEAEALVAALEAAAGEGEQC